MSTHHIEMSLNGLRCAGEVEARVSLADFLRDDAGYTGVHLGCEHGVCGACTVRVDGVAQRACLMLAVQVDGCAVQTIEGLAAETGGGSDSDTLGDLQAAFKRHHALQCGFCSAGILMSAADWLQRVPTPTEVQVREMLSGHLCRCTGYTPIVAAILEVAQARAEVHAANATKAAHV